MNKVSLLGRLTKDPDLRYTSTGTAVATFTVAVTRSYKNQNNEYDSDFIRVKAWRKQAETVANFFSKGNRIIVHGEIETGSYEGADGKRVFTTEVKMNEFEFVDSKKDQERQSDQSPQTENSQQQSYQAVERDPFESKGRPIDIADDDLPF